MQLVYNIVTQEDKYWIIIEGNCHILLRNGKMANFVFRKWQNKNRNQWNFVLRLNKQKIFREMYSSVSYEPNNVWAKNVHNRKIQSRRTIFNQLMLILWLGWSLCMYLCKYVCKYVTLSSPHLYLRNHTLKLNQTLHEYLFRVCRHFTFSRLSPQR